MTGAIHSMSAAAQQKCIYKSSLRRTRHVRHSTRMAAVVGDAGSGFKTPPGFPKPGEQRDYPRPDLESTSQAFRDAGSLSAEIASLRKEDRSMTVRTAMIASSVA